MKAIEIELRKSQILLDVVSKMNVLGRTLGTDNNLKVIAGYISSPDDNDTKPIVARSMTEGFDRVKNVCQRYLVYGRTSDDNRLEQMVKTVVFGTTQAADNGGDIHPITKKLAEGKKYTIKVEYANGQGDLEYTIAKLSPSNLYDYEDEDILFKHNSITGSGTDTYEITPEGYSYIGMAMDGTEADGTLVKMTVYEQQDVTITLALSMSNNFNEGVVSTIKSCAHHIIVSNILTEFLRDQNADKAAQYKADIAEQEAMLLEALNSVRPFSRRSQDWS